MKESLVGGLVSKRLSGTLRSSRIRFSLRLPPHSDFLRHHTPVRGHVCERFVLNFTDSFYGAVLSDCSPNLLFVLRLTIACSILYPQATQPGASSSSSSFFTNPRRPLIRRCKMCQSPPMMICGLHLVSSCSRIVKPSYYRRLPTQHDDSHPSATPPRS